MRRLGCTIRLTTQMTRYFSESGGLHCLWHKHTHTSILQGRKKQNWSERKGNRQNVMKFQENIVSWRRSAVRGQINWLVVIDRPVRPVSCCPGMTSLGRNSSDKNTEYDEDIQRPRKCVQDVCGAWSSILKIRVLCCAINIGYDSKCDDLECTVQRFKTRACPPNSPPPRPGTHSNQDSQECSCTEDHAQLGAVACGPPQCAELLVSFLTHVLLTPRKRPARVVCIADLSSAIGRRYGYHRPLTTFEESVANDRLSMEDIRGMNI